MSELTAGNASSEPAPDENEANPPQKRRRVNVGSGGGDCGGGSGTLMEASLKDAMDTAKVPNDLRATIIANVSSFEKHYETKDASKANEMMRLVNDTRERLQKLCVDRLDGRYSEGLPRAQVIAPPGFGKSRLAGMLIESRFKGTNGQMIVAILVPTIELVKQFWRNLDPKVDSRSADHPFPSLRSVKFLRLCSAEDNDGATTDLNVALTIAADSMKCEDGSIGPPRLVIISTYQSCARLSEVLKTRMLDKDGVVEKEANWKLDLLICDEAHKTACKSESREAYWKMPLEDALVPARHRLFLTATPKIDLGSTEAEGENGDEGEVLHADMSDEATYGPKVFELRLEHGIALRVLRDLEIRVVVVQGEKVKALLKDKDKDKATMAHLISQMSAVRHALDSIGNDPRKGFVFTSRIEEVNDLYKSEQVGKSLNGYQRFKYHSGESTKKNTEQLDLLRDSNRALMFNCKSLGLGLDLPEAALVAILSGMTSWAALVQAVGRVLRQCASLIFQRAVLLLPILWVEGEEDEDAAAAAREADVSTKVRGKGPPPKRQKQKGPSKKKKHSTTTAGDLHQTSKILKVLADELPRMSDDLRAIQAGRMGARCLSIEKLNTEVTAAELAAVTDGVISETLGRVLLHGFPEFMKELTKLKQDGVDVNKLPADERGGKRWGLNQRVSKYRLLAANGNLSDEMVEQLRGVGLDIGHRNRANSDEAFHVHAKIRILWELKKKGVDLGKITTNCAPADIGLDPDIVIEQLTADEALRSVLQLRRDKLLTDGNKEEIIRTGFRLVPRDENLTMKIELLESHKAELVGPKQLTGTAVALRNWYSPAQYDKREPAVDSALNQLRKLSGAAEVYYVQTMAFMTTLSVDDLKELLKRGGAFTQEQFTLVLERSRGAVTHEWHMINLKNQATQSATIKSRLSAIKEQMDSLQSMDPPFGFVPASEKGGSPSFVENLLLWCDLKTRYPLLAKKDFSSHLKMMKKDGITSDDEVEKLKTWLYITIRRNLEKWISSVRKDVKEYKRGDMETLFKLDLLRHHDFFAIYSEQSLPGNQTSFGSLKISDIKRLKEIFPSDDDVSTQHACIDGEMPADVTQENS